MERRKAKDRRQVHMFVSKDRRDGPFDRRDDETRRREVEREREKIERIRAYKQKNKAPLPARPMITKKRMIVVGIVLLAWVTAMLLVK